MRWNSDCGCCGPRSMEQAEKTSTGAMQWFELEPIVGEMIEQAESEHAQVHRSTKKFRKHPGRQELPANLPRVKADSACTPDQRECKARRRHRLR